MTLKQRCARILLDALLAGNSTDAQGEVTDEACSIASFLSRHDYHTQRRVDLVILTVANGRMGYASTFYPTSNVTQTILDWLVAEKMLVTARPPIEGWTTDGVKK